MSVFLDGERSDDAEEIAQWHSARPAIMTGGAQRYREIAIRLMSADSI
jgi:hypothetical protein